VTTLTNGTRLTFSGGTVATVSGDQATGGTTIAVQALPGPIASGETATGYCANPHFLNPDMTVGAVTVSDCIFEYAGTDGQGDCFLNFGPTLVNNTNAKCLGFFGGSYADYSSGANTSTLDDLKLANSSGSIASGDAVYFGNSPSTVTFTTLALYISTAYTSSGTPAVLAWEYWNGSAWTAVSGLSDGSNGFQTAGRVLVSFTSPSGWAATTVNGVSSYWLRARWTSADGSVTARPAAAQMCLSAISATLLPVVYTMLRCIEIPNAAGDDTGTLMTCHGNLLAQFVFEHNTYYMGSQAPTVGEAYCGYKGMVQSFRGNLGWSTSPGATSYKLRGENNSNPAGTAVDVVLAANCDYNAAYNFSTTYGSTVAGQGATAGYDVKITGTPGVHDVDGGSPTACNPNFVDPHRNFASWSSYNGGPGTAADTLARLASVNDPTPMAGSTIASFMSYIRAGYSPKNTSLMGASYPGDVNGPVGAGRDIGALAVYPYEITRFALWARRQRS
jgi:hypothetical protein